MSQKTAKTVTNKFLNTTKSDREGGRTVGFIPQSLVNRGLRFLFVVFVLYLV